MKYIAIIIAKITIFFGNILHRGSSLPGKLALKIDKNLLKKLKYPQIKIAVTGSSGKGSTSSLIANTLKDNGYSICYNDKGSNMAWGITSSLLRNSTITGKIKSDILIIEVDERYAKKVLKHINPTHIVITNITKDQPPRQHHVDEIYNEILVSLTKDASIITNMDDPYLRKFSKDVNNKFITYALAENKYSYKKNIYENLNMYYCPYCGEELIYDYYNFETLGKYKCSNCDFSWQMPDIIGEKLDYNTKTFKIKDNTIPINGDMLFHVYNILASYTTLSLLDMKEDKIIEGIKKYAKNLNLEYDYKGKTFKALDCKAENATTYNASILKVSEDNRKKDVIIGWKEISRRYNHYDISWLYDIEFELLNNEELNKIYCCGPDCYNIEKRLILAGISKDKIVTELNMENIKEEVINDHVQIVYGILNFDYMDLFRSTFND